MADTVTIIEHKALPITDRRQQGRVAITRGEVERLEAMKSLPKNTYSLRHNSIKWSQFCGVVRVGDLMLEILPKIHGRESNPGACRAALVRMLRAAGFMKLHRVGAALMNLQKISVLDVFIQDLCEQIEKELLQGKLRQYIAYEENLPVLRGKLLGGYQLRHNLAHKERLYCQYDELSEDIHINQVIRLTLKILMPLAQSQFIKGRLTRLLHAFDEISDISIEKAKLDKVELNRHEERYADIYHICQQFIESLYQDVTAGEDKSFSLLFDMNELFEAWITPIIRPVAREFGLSVKRSGPVRKLVQRTGVGEIFSLIPDISLLDKTGGVVLIADAKWKLLEGKESKLGISQADLYQMQAYASRYGINNMGIIYLRMQIFP